MQRIDARNFDGIGHKSSGRLSARGRLLTDEALSHIYLDPYHRFARIIVDRPAEDCTRRGWKIQVEDSDDGADPYAEEMQRLDVAQTFKRAHELSRIYGGAGVLMIVDDDGALDEPISANVRGVKALQVFSRRELEPADYYEDIEHPKFGQPRHYWLHPKTRHAAQSLQIVHSDRIIRWDGLEVPDDLAWDFDGWGQSVLEAAYAVMTDIDVATDSVREAIDEFQYAILKLKNLSALMTGADGDDNSMFQARLDGIDEGKQRTRKVVIDAEDDYIQQNTSFTGLIEAYQITQQNLSAITRIPITLLFGQSPGGLSTDDQSGTRNYYDGIRSLQTEKYEPAIRRLTELLDGPDEGWTVEFHDLLVPSEAEDAATKKTIAETDAINMLNGVYTAEEVRSRYGVSGFSHDIVLTADDAEDSESFEKMQAEFQALQESGEEMHVIPKDMPGAPEEQREAREFNGAQISSMREIIQAVALGELPEGGAVEMLMLGFNLDREHAKRFFADKKIKQPEEPDARSQGENDGF